MLYAKVELSKIVGTYNKWNYYHRNQSSVKHWGLEDEKWRGRKSGCIQWAEQEHGACERSVAFMRNWKVNVTGILRTVRITVYVEGCHSKNNGNWEIIQLLKAGVGSFMLLFQTNKNKRTKTLTGTWRRDQGWGVKTNRGRPFMGLLWLCKTENMVVWAKLANVEMMRRGKYKEKF